MKYILHVLTLSIIVFTQSGNVFATMPSAPPVWDETRVDYLETGDVRAAFEYVMQPTIPTLAVPTVVELPIQLSPSERSRFAIYESTTGNYIPYYLKETYQTTPEEVFARSQSTYATYLVDKDPETGVDYDVQVNGEKSTATIFLTTKEPVESSSINFLFDKNVRLPKEVTLFVEDENAVERIVVATTAMTGSMVNFPKTYARTWRIVLTYDQPLRINEIYLTQDNAEQTVDRRLRFLAQPGTKYDVYYAPDRSVYIPEGEAGNLYADVGVLRLASVTGLKNQMYVQADTDQDGVVDATDNCSNVSNPLQEDLDVNGRGDVCDDFDRDGIMAINDNCPNYANINQRDQDGDGIGDVCDEMESRLTEQYPWLPWVGIGVAVLVIGVLFVLVAMTPKKEEKSMV